MEVKSSLNHLRMSPRKIRLVIDVIRQMPVATALDQLRFINKLAAEPIAKLIKSAIANGENTYSLKRDNLYIKEIRSDEGVMLKRWMPRAHGRATSIRKRGCHLSLVLAEIKAGDQPEKKVVKAADPVKLEKLVKEGEAATQKIGAKAERDKSRKAAGAKTKMFRRKAG
ncbi:MAG: 50S ribosomal protein L22 [bacterium]|nr:50S ribosomal protein L22 [bacterium]